MKELNITRGEALLYKFADLFSIIVVASCKKTEYEVFLIFDETRKTFVPAPCSRCSCFGGNFFCSHMVAVLLYLSIIQHDKTNNIERIIACMPMEIKLFQTKCVSWELLFGDIQGLSASSNKVSKFSALAKKLAEDDLGEELEADSSAGGRSSLFEQLKKTTEEDVILQDNCQELEEALSQDFSYTIDVVGEAIQYSKECQKNVQEPSKGRDVTLQQIDDFNEYIMHSRLPNGCTANKLEQLEIHERLHQRFVTGRLPTCMISHYLAFFSLQRAEMIDAIKKGNLVFFD